MAGRNKPEGRLMPRIPTWLSVGARRVICINPSRHSHPDPAALCTWWNGSQRCCPDNWALDYRLWEYGEGEKTKRKGVIVWTRGRLISQICLNFGRLIKNCARPWTVWTHLAVNHFGGGLRRDAGDLNRPISEEVFVSRPLHNLHLPINVITRTIFCVRGRSAQITHLSRCPCARHWTSDRSHVNLAMPCMATATQWCVSGWIRGFCHC